jgi:hypothetical protein
MCAYQKRAQAYSFPVTNFRVNLLADKDAGRRYCFELANMKNPDESYWFGAAGNDEFDQWVNILMTQTDQPLDMGDERPKDKANLNPFQLLQQELTREAVTVYDKKHQEKSPRSAEMSPQPSPRNPVDSH